MDDAGRMRGVERIGKGNSHINNLREFERTACNTLMNRLAPEQLHDEEFMVVRGRADIVDRADVGMLKRRDGPRFSLEPFARRSGSDEILREHFDRNVSIKAGIVRTINLAHAAFAYRRNDVIWAEFVSWRERHLLDLA